jgi:hypothetical protein
MDVVTVVVTVTVIVAVAGITNDETTHQSPIYFQLHKEQCIHVYFQFHDMDFQVLERMHLDKAKEASRLYNLCYSQVLLYSRGWY